MHIPFILILKLKDKRQIVSKRKIETEKKESERAREKTVK